MEEIEGKFLWPDRIEEWKGEGRGRRGHFEWNDSKALQLKPQSIVILLSGPMLGRGTYVYPLWYVLRIEITLFPAA
jgi:hypothetical protein